MIKTTSSFSVDEDTTTNLEGAYPVDLVQATPLRQDRSGRAISQSAWFIALYADVTALEIEAIQEGRLILREAAAAAGFDIEALAWQTIRLA